MSFIRWVVSLIVAGGIFAAAVSAEEPPLRMVYTEYPPLHWEENGEMKGISIDVMDEIFGRRMKVKVTHRQFPWKRAQAMVRSGSADGFITLSTEERREYADFSNAPVIVMKTSIFTRNDNPNIPALREVKTVVELRPYDLISYLGDGWSQEHLSDFNIVWRTDTRDVLKVLNQSPRPLVFLQSSLPVRHLLKKTDPTAYGRENITEIETPLSDKPFVLGIGKHSPHVERLAEFDRHLREMKADGSLEGIYHAYF